MIDMRYKPRFLPQVSAPFSVVLQKLGDEGVDYEMVEVDANELQPLQGITFSDDVGNISLDDMKPIWISDDLKVLDGHHRMVRALLDNVRIKAVKIKANEKDACRILNKIQDIYDYEQASGMEEVVNNDIINDENDIDNNYTDRSEFLSTLEEDNASIQTENSNSNQQTIIAYRKDPIKENSVVGNFFTLKPLAGFSKYQIEFDNLLDTNALGVTYKDSQEPADIMAKIWFPNVNFEELSKKHNTTSSNLKNKAIAEKAMKMGYDGIKYGDTLIQGLK
jgi:uncharacterized lipoprotein YehR (DUF1307 family)